MNSLMEKIAMGNQHISAFRAAEAKAKSASSQEEIVSALKDMCVSHGRLILEKVKLTNSGQTDDATLQQISSHTVLIDELGDSIKEINRKVTGMMPTPVAAMMPQMSQIATNISNFTRVPVEQLHKKAKDVIKPVKQSVLESELIIDFTSPTGSEVKTKVPAITSETPGATSVISEMEKIDQTKGTLSELFEKGLQLARTKRNQLKPQSKHVLEPISDMAFSTSTPVKKEAPFQKATKALSEEPLSPGAVLDSNKPVVVNFHANWCVNSKNIINVWKEFKAKHLHDPAFQILDCDCGLHPEMKAYADRMGVDGFPTILFLNKGKRLEFQFESINTFVRDLENFIKSNM